MITTLCSRSALALLIIAFLLIPALAPGQPAPRPAEKFTPRLESIAETKLLMEGLAHANFRGLEKLLSKKPESVEAWTFARGQALLIAETGNLLMLRPPRNDGRELWHMRATELRESATALARTVARSDHEKSREGLRTLAQSCNKCHESFQVPVRLTPFKKQGDESLD